MLSTRSLLETTDFPPISRQSVDTLQVNLGYRCNQQCKHCHVNAGPRRTEVMSPEVIKDVLDYLGAGGVTTLDLTGGAPEMHPQFHELVAAARGLGVEVIDRCNLSILTEPGYEGMAEFLAAQGVRVVASMPCYLEENVDSQRGRGVYEKSITALKQLNGLGYGADGSGLCLDLVYNPQGPSLPPPQEALEVDYKRELKQRYEITNMPIQRFGSQLLSRGEFEGYMTLLRDAYSEANLDAVMCRTTLSISWQGVAYDCDFNQMLEMPSLIEGKPKSQLRDLIGRDLSGQPIVIADHCYGCTAGQGSSCGGALSS